MSEYLIQDTTMRAMAEQMRRISGKTEQLNGAEIAEIFSRTQGNLKTDGEYLIEAINYDGTVIKSGNYDTGEIFAMPVPHEKDDMTFQGWTCTSPLKNYYTVIDNCPVMAGSIYAPNDDKFIIQVNISEPNTYVSFDGIITKNDWCTIDWKDGTIGRLDSLYDHTYTEAGIYQVEITGEVEFYSNDDDGSLSYREPLIFNDYNGRSLIEMVAIPSYLTRIPEYFFYGLTSLKKVIISNNIEATGISCFQDCSSLECIVIPNKITTIKEKMFYNCTNLRTVILPYGLTEIHDNAFCECSSLKDIIIPETITHIGEYAFCNCESLVNFPVFSENITSISAAAFYGCKNLTNVIIPSGVTTVGSMAFSDCNSLSIIEIPDSVTTISNHSFYVPPYNEKKIKTLILPSVTYIGRGAFCNREIESFVLSAEQVCQTDGNVFGETGWSNESAYISSLKMSIYVPDHLVSEYKTDNYWSAFSSKIKPLSEYIGTS